MPTNALCWLLRRRLSAYADGELLPAARGRVEAHLHRCQACAAELRQLGRLRMILASRVPEPPEAVWQAFWPQVRARVAAAPSPAPESHWQRLWGAVAGHRRLAFGSALAAGAVAVLAVLAPWQPVAERPVAPAPPAAPSISATVAFQPVLIQSVETGDPQSSVMVFSSPESDLTVVWVFGLERTGT